MSGAPLDMSLDDLIKQNKKPAGTSSRGRGRSGGPGPARRFPNRTDTRPAPYPTQVAESNWQHDMFGADVYSGGPPVGGAGSIETGTKLYVSNLDYGVSNQDVKELFSEVGDLKRCAVHYDRSGRSKGTAEVVFSRRQDAVAAVKRYNNVQLDGKPMKIEIVGTNISTPAAAGPGPVIGSFGDANGIIQRSGQGGGRFGRSRGGGGGGGGRGQGFGRGGGQGFGRGGRGFGRGGGRGRGRGRDEKVSAEDLDADLEKYHSAAMET